MKKRIITLLAILALLVVCAAFSVSAEYGDVRDTFKCPCSTCNGTVYTGEWKTLGTAKATLSNGGHYYVNAANNPGTITGQQTLGGGSEVVILIDNTTLEGKNSGRLFVMNGPSSGTKNPIHLHIVGNNGGKIHHAQTGSATQAPLVQVGAYSVGHLYLYGDLELSATATKKPQHGGLIKLPSAGRLYIKDCDNMGLTNTKDPVLKGNEVTGDGGVVYLQSGSPKFYMECGTLEGGSAPNGRGNSVFASGTSTIEMTGGTIKSEGTTGSRVYLDQSTTMLLAGNATILSNNNDYTGNIVIKRSSVTKDGKTTNYYPKLNIAKTWTGKTSFKMEKADGTINPAVPGSTDIGNYSSDTTPTTSQAYWVRGVEIKSDGTKPFYTGSAAYFNANDAILYAESPDTENPRVGGWTYTMMPYRCQIVRKSGTTWCVDYANAVDDVANEKNIYIKVWAVNRTFTIDADQTVYIDLNGRNYTSKATVNGKLYVFDSTAEAGKAGHTIQATKVEPLTQINGKAYVNQIATVNSKSIATTYPVDVKISKANLRLATAGIYYTAAVTCADEIKDDLIYGVAVQLGGEIEKLADAAYTAALVNSDAAGAGNSLIVNSILYKDAEGNVVANAKERSNTTIYAKAYLAVGTDVENLDTTNVVLGDSVELSLTDLMSKVDEKYAKAEADGGFTADQKTMINEFCTKFAAAAEWVLPNILGTEA